MMTVRERGETVATLRWIHVRLMETLAAWVPTTPEMEVKLLFGAHIWDMAQHADALGKRTHELRMPLQHSIEPEESYRSLLADTTSTANTAERVATFYDAILPAIAARCRHYLEGTDRLLDAPTVRILEHILREQERMIAESRELREQLPVLELHDAAPLARFLDAEAAMPTIVHHRGEPVAAGAAS
ncbi:MAG TPA: hypothetical protein VEK11_11420 [Thermoanaerobaculia bacterium]|jgi:hypothetical protein|nr:hypothetical protein [Thermoanaerobaculia bacterium]